jgi:outer membrane protein OmpA-like peptidoglycan-associated protein
VAIDLVDLVKGYLTPDVIGKASDLVGESSGATQKALGGIVPTLVSAVMNTASTNEGSQQLVRTLDAGKYNGSALNSAASLFTGGLATQNGLTAGRGLVESLFGSKLGGVTDLLARFAGIRPESASSLLALAAPLVMHVIGNQRTAIGPDASSLSSLLRSQRSMLSGLLPAGLGSLLGWSAVTSGAETLTSSVSGAASRVTREMAAAVPEPVGQRQSWFAPLLVLAALALGALVWLSWPTAAVREAARTVSELQLPGGVKIAVPNGSFNFSLANWLAGSNDTNVPKRFVFDDLKFESDSIKLTPDSVPTVKTLTAVLRAYPAVTVALEGHTDSTGDPSANKKLSLDRADAVKDIMVKDGIAASRITATGFGEENPVASNETAQGRALNRRLELVVLKR